MSRPLDRRRTPRPPGSDWFEDWFGEEYLALYEHRDLQEAVEVGDLIDRGITEAGGAVDGPVLDLACGAGRHQRMLADHGWFTVGLDLSPSLLRAARVADRGAALVRADMRALPFATSSFALVVNLFTSFGYFRDDVQHQRVLAEVARVTRRGGWFVLDFLNAQQVRDTLVPRDERLVGTTLVEQEREITADGRFVRKTITLGELGRTFVERVRLFEPGELATLCTEAGFRVEAAFGDYAGGALTADAPRAILFARRQ
ncbi:MAG: SAM-dependent methyltransferase [Gemmatimonadetes bacterium]|jgi:SAM-dependent methyltransferase|nr:SAM-dependent methyltransferase [Gemmatimonadota bacterium]